MKKPVLLICVAMLSVCGIASAQFTDWKNRYIREMKGDTAVIKDYYDMDSILTVNKVGGTVNWVS